MKVEVPRLQRNKSTRKMSRTKSLRLTVQSGSAFVDGLEGWVKNVQFGNWLALPTKTKKDIDQQVGQALKTDKVKNRFDQLMIRGALFKPPNCQTYCAWLVGVKHSFLLGGREKNISMVKQVYLREPSKSSQLSLKKKKHPIAHVIIS